MIQLSRYRPGPGMIVSAAFIGPGTVTACTLAGANFGFALVWALVFATVTTIILQSFAIRIALVTRLGLAEAMMQSLRSPALKLAAALLLVAALVIGNAAYEAGNMSGAVIGLEAVFGKAITEFKTVLILAISLIAAAMLVFSKPVWIERVLIALVLVMSMAFLLTFLLTRPDFMAMLAGLVPRIPDGGLMTAIALIGTTIVPYNLFLHAASVQQRWKSSVQLPEANADNAISIGLGGLVSIAIMATAASALMGGNAEIRSAVDMARQLEPLFGNLAVYTLGIGLFAAGLTSAITAPLATGYVVREIFAKWAGNSEKVPFAIGALLVIATGAIVASSGYSPIEIIFVAQIANGLLLPIIAFFLLRLANDSELLGEHANDMRANLLGILILAITTLLGIRLVARAIGWWP